MIIIYYAHLHALEIWHDLLLKNIQEYTTTQYIFTWTRPVHLSLRIFLHRHVCVISEWQAPLGPQSAPFLITESKETTVLLNTKSCKKETHSGHVHCCNQGRNVAVCDDVTNAVKSPPDTYLSHVSIICIFSRPKCMLSQFNFNNISNNL